VLQSLRLAVKYFLELPNVLLERLLVRFEERADKAIVEHFSVLEVIIVQSSQDHKVNDYNDRAK